MCGIAGLAGSGLEESHLVRMLDQMAYRGPDGRGTYIDDHVALGNLLLAIVDIGNGHQPQVRTFNGETYVAVFNGEIYNFRDLRQDLTREGFHFETDCDTEVALAAFAVWGKGAAKRLDGQWAIAVWAAKRRRLILSRDPFGIKPLFYYRRGDFFAFASEPKAILSLPDVSKRPNVEAVREYFLHGFAFAAGYSLSHRSFFEGIESLPPGHALIWEPGKSPELSSEFTFPLAPPLVGAELGEAASLLKAAVRCSTEATLMGDAPIGVALSGGLDSSVIATIAAETKAARGEGPLLASCITYRSQDQNEDATHASLLVKWLGAKAPIELVFSVMDLESYLGDLDEMIRHFDEPHWEVKQLAMFNNYRCLKAHGAKVVLTGEGADELFFGYYHRFPGFKNPVIRSASDLRSVWGARIPEALRLLAGANSDHLRGLQDLAIERFYEPAIAAGADPDRAMQCWYLSTFLHWLLIDNDRCSMAFSLEGRFPFLNREVYELAFRIPPSAQIGADLGGEKLVLREAFRASLPEEIWRHRKKAPLPSPRKLAFHRAIRDALELSIHEASPEAWDVVDRQGALSILEHYSLAIGDLERGGSLEGGGEDLTRYLRLDEPWSIRTPHAFGLLTFLRWWRMNFS